MHTSTVALGIDAGGTLIKIACEQSDGSVQFHHFKTTDMSEAALWVSRHGIHVPVCLTGGKAALFQQLLQKEVSQIPEFDATCSGIRWLLHRQGIRLSSFLLTNVGTGTSIHYVSDTRHYRVGGTGVGGGTLLGLSAMATGVKEFSDIVGLAKDGSRNNIDLLVSHIYEGAAPPIPGQLTASNFGRWLQTGGSERAADILASIVRLVGETVATVSVHAAGQSGASCVVYIGSSFIGNDLLYEAVAEYTELRGSKAVAVRDGHYSGAIGAMISLHKVGVEFS